MVLAHPLRAPSRLPGMLARRAVAPKDVVALTRWAHGALRPGHLKRGGDTSLVTALDRSGVSGELRRVIDRFLSGVVLDDSGATSNAFALLLVRTFALGCPHSQPEAWRRSPASWPPRWVERVALQRRVVDIARVGSGWQVTADDGSRVQTREVVVATDAPQAGQWIGGVSATCTASSPTGGPPPTVAGPPMLWVDGRPGATGPVVNTAVISAAAPSYAPAGRHLIAASALLGPGRPEPTEDQCAPMRRRSSASPGRDWQPVIRHVVARRVAASAAAAGGAQEGARSSGLWVCGDHRDTASIQGAWSAGAEPPKGCSARWFSCI